MQPKEQWAAVDRYITDLFVASDDPLAGTLQACKDAGLPSIHVAPNQGKWLMLMARAMGAKRILEIGTLGGYSTIWLARGLAAGGKIITLEFDPKHAAIARENFNRMGLADVIDLRLGNALDSLPKLEAEKAGPFDLIFIDADKVSYPNYLDWSLRLARPGALIIADNVVREGEVVDAASKDKNVQAVRRFNELMAKNPRLSATEIQTVGAKGYDGFAFAVVGA